MARCVTNAVQSSRENTSFCNELEGMATRASGLKILVSVVRFRPWALEVPETGMGNAAVECAPLASATCYQLSRGSGNVLQSTAGRHLAARLHLFPGDHGGPRLRRRVLAANMRAGDGGLFLSLLLTQVRLRGFGFRRLGGLHGLGLRSRWCGIYIHLPQGHSFHA